jgi:hypothetical protein
MVEVGGIKAMSLVSMGHANAGILASVIPSSRGVLGWIV